MTHRPEDHLKLVHKIANRYSKGNRMEYEDIYQEGCIGLMRACREYQDKKIPFGAFAGMHIKFAILHALRGSHLLYVDSNTVTLAMKIHKHGLRELPAEEIAAKINKRADLVERALDYLKLDVRSLDFEYNDRSSDKKVTILDSYGYTPAFDDQIYLEQMLDVFEVSDQDKPIMRLVMDGYSVRDAARANGESYKAAQQRKSMRKYRVMDKKGLVYA